MNDPKESLLDLTRRATNRLRIVNVLSERSSRQRYSRMMAEVADKAGGNDHNLPIRFVIFNYPRTGSNLLCSLLNQHPEILCHHEIFNPERIYYAKDFKDYFPELSNASRQDFIRGKVGSITIGDRNRFPEKLFLFVWQHAFEAKAVGFN
ncbi:MAG: hypothetical protein VKK04_10095, partial [Synechococcales bacterium]|nr:hypothetical protein [Synechococcales bacterium]